MGKDSGRGGGGRGGMISVLCCVELRGCVYLLLV